MSGYNLPPGCTLADIDAAYGATGWCILCNKHIEECTCPCCPLCRYIGDPHCEINQGDGCNAQTS